MSLTWCQIGASLCLVGVSAWGITEWACGGAARPAPINVVGPAAPAEDTAAVVRWALERAGVATEEHVAAEGPGSEPASVPVAGASAPAPRAIGSRAIPVPANTAKGGGKVSSVGRATSRGSGGSVGRQASRDFTRALGRSNIRRASNWVPRFSGRRR